MNKKLLALSGYANTGKSTVAEYLWEYFNNQGLNCCIDAMASPGKFAVSNMLDVALEQLEEKPWRYEPIFSSSTAKHSPIDLVRIVLESAAEHYPTLWADVSIYKFLKSDIDVYILPDLRRVREWEVLRSRLGADLVHIHLERGINLTEVHQHVSESEVITMREKADKVVNIGNLVNTTSIDRFCKDMLTTLQMS